MRELTLLVRERLERSIADPGQDPGHPFLFGESARRRREFTAFIEGALLEEQELGIEELLDRAASGPRGFRSPTYGWLAWGIVRVLRDLQPQGDLVPNEYLRFIRRYLKGQEHRDSVVCFNWDLLLEVCLSSEEVQWCYGTDGSRLQIVKPHGSLNWNSFKARGLRSDHPDWAPIFPGSDISFLASAPFADFDPRDTNEALRLVVLPGRAANRRESDGLGEVWGHAAAAMKDNSTIVFIGYSLPEYDEQSRVLLTSACDGKDVQCVDPDPELGERLSIMLDRSVAQECTSFELSSWVQ